jgi:small subunit ribosomal protein S1
MLVTEEIPTISLGDVEPKMKLTGQVKQIQLAGAILDVGLEECDAVLHISQIRHKRVKNVRDVLEEGQKVEVWVRNVDKENQRLDVTMIQPAAVSWNDLEAGQVYMGKVIRLEKFGVFVDIGAERPGLVHISELAHDYVKTPSEVVERGQEIEVKVLGVNLQKNQIDLSMKALHSAPEAESFSNEPEEQLPTAMALALKRAMEGSDEEPVDNSDNTKKQREDAEQAEIIRRALERQQQSN